VSTDAAVIDVDGVLRGKIMAKDKFISAAKDGFGFCGVIFGWDSKSSSLPLTSHRFRWLTIPL
jgi:glutamine synthetase